MNKFVIFLFAATLGLWVYLRPDQVVTCIDTVKVWLGYAPTPAPAPEEPQEPTPPPGIYFLTERVSVMTNSGIRSVAKGTEVKLVSQRDSTATVEDGRGEFQVDFYKLSRDFEMRGESHLGIQQTTGVQPTGSTEASDSIPSSNNETRRALLKRIAEVDAQLMDSMDKLRAMSTSDPVRGRKIEDVNAANVIQSRISTLEADLSKLKAELAKAP